MFSRVGCGFSIRAINSRPMGISKCPWALNCGVDLTKNVDDRSSIAKGMSRGSEIVSVCMMMIIPALIGYFVDQKIGTRFLLTILGFVFGMSAAVWQLMKIVKAISEEPSGFQPTKDESTGQD